MTEYTAEPMSVWFMWAFGISMITSFIMWLVFAQLTMRRIEKQMKEDGLANTFQWDGVGGRIIFYAGTLALPEKIAYRVDRRLIDSPLIKRYASRADHIRARLFLLCLFTWIIIGFYGAIFGTH